MKARRVGVKVSILLHQDISGGQAPPVDRDEPALFMEIEVLHLQLQPGKVCLAIRKGKPAKKDKKNLKMGIKIEDKKIRPC
jgi:hypothetical protein